VKYQALFIQFTGATGNFTITGISGGADGKSLILHNPSSYNMTLANESAFSSAANRIDTLAGADKSTTGKGVFTLIYDTNSSRWIFTGVVS
jgi:hypothetical protein